MLAAVLTPPGRGALAVVHVSGEGAEALVRRIFSRNFDRHPVVGTLAARGEVIDEVMVRRARGFTGEETVEITCHGGRAPVERLLEALASLGARAVGPGELLERGFETGHLDRIQVEALSLLPGAPTERSALMLQAQAEGALSKAVAGIRSNEDAGLLLRTAPLGLALAFPRRIVLAGAPNVGKSTLFNALLKSDRVLVSPQAGTTRDPVRELIAIDQVPFELVDTAGLESPRDALEAGAIERTREVLGQADLVLFVRDARSLGGPRPEPGLGPSGTPPVVLEVVNKIDLFQGVVLPGSWPISARTGQGLEALRGAVLEALGLPASGPRESAQVFTPRQVAALGLAARDSAAIPEARRWALRGGPER
jgi:tRNA modification GTPase